VVASAKNPAVVVQHLVLQAAAHVVPALVVQAAVIPVAALQQRAEHGKRFRRLFWFQPL